MKEQAPARLLRGGVPLEEGLEIPYAGRAGAAAARTMRDLVEALTAIHAPADILEWQVRALAAGHRGRLEEGLEKARHRQDGS
jgi:hypothetical protein